MTWNDKILISKKDNKDNIVMLGLVNYLPIKYLYTYSVDIRILNEFDKILRGFSTITFLKSFTGETFTVRADAGLIDKLYNLLIKEGAMIL